MIEKEQGIRFTEIGKEERRGKEAAEREMRGKIWGLSVQTTTLEHF